MIHNIVRQGDPQGPAALTESVTIPGDVTFPDPGFTTGPSTLTVTGRDGQSLGANTIDSNLFINSSGVMTGEVVTKTARHVWLSSSPLSGENVHERCNLGARYRWGIEAGILVEKRCGYHYEHCFAYSWSAMKGYHYLMRIAHLLNVLVQHSRQLVKLVKELGARGLIKFIRQTLSGPWLDADRVREDLAQQRQFRLSVE